MREIMLSVASGPSDKWASRPTALTNHTSGELFPLLIVSIIDLWPLVHGEIDSRIFEVVIG